MSNRVLKKEVFHIHAKLCSPLCVSCGDGILTDQDVIRDYDKNPFIPGSSLAGAMRGYLGIPKNQKCIFGYSDQKEDGSGGRMSSAFVSDFVFTTKTISKIRDSVALSEDKTAKTGAKFDMEVLETGAEGYFILELVIRENDIAQDMYDQLGKIFYGWNRHEIRLGAKKTRGYGELEINSIKQKTYSRDNILEYKDAYSMEKADTDFTDATKIWLGKYHTDTPKYLTVEVPLKLTGGISIRQYAAKKGEPDFVHVTIGEDSDKKAVIPGTSFAGAIRHRMAEIMTELKYDCHRKKNILDGIWGYVEQGADQDATRAKQSSIVVNECILEGSKPLTMVRNGISRFESAAKDGALFKELSYVGGTTTLVLRIRRQPEQSETTDMLKLLMPVLQDIRNGYLPVGGQTSVGRGIFEGNGRIRIDGKELEDEYA